MWKALLVGISAALLLAYVAVAQRHSILVPLTTPGEEPPLNEDVAMTPGGKQADDGYYVVVALDAQTFAIAEPRYWARNFNYLILGTERAIMFDAGAGHYDIRPVVDSLTDLPVTFLPSHFHYDHVGQEGAFDHVAVVDLPHIRKQANGSELKLTWEQHLGSAEGLEIPTLMVDEWIAPGETIDLGERTLSLIYTPGHTDNSVSLYDIERKVMFSGDFVTGNLAGAIAPTAGLGDYLQSAQKVLRSTDAATIIRGAHGAEGGDVPTNDHSDVQDLRDTLIAIRDGKLEGTGTFPITYVVNDNMILVAEPRWLQDWTPTYPDKE